MFAFPNSLELLRESNSWKSWKTLSLAAVFFLLVASSSIFESPRYSSLRRMTRERETLNVFFIYSDSPVAQKTYKDLNHDTSLHIIMAQTQDQLEYLHQNPCVNNAFQRYQEFVKKDQPHLASELWKFCALSEKGGLYLDIDSPLLVPVEKIRSLGPNVAVQSAYFENTAHGSFLLMDDTKIALDMARLLIETPVQTFLHSPLLLATTLYDKIQNSSSEWHTLQHSCTMNPLSGRKLSLYSKANRIAHLCPSETGYCCQIVDSHQVIMMTRFPIYPIQMIPESLPRPYVMPDENDPVHDELPFISTIIEKINNRAKDAPKTPNFFDTLLQNNCLPSDLQCSLCLREKKGADCKICKDVCPCYCKTLCKVSVDKKFVAKEVKVLPPRFARDPNRLIPRIVHQTWFEPVSPEKYPNMSRLIESFKLSGWEYKFYDDDSSRVVLKTHFPPEVLQAYDALKPGAFKADLFRYCVLLIYGGVYADMDVLLEANLEAAVGPDVGFMVPVDEPGSVSVLFILVFMF
jgi:mannosyltransferase OCH1-like enzyme